MTTETKSKTGVCEYSGQPTKGGKFVAGNDARLKSLLGKAAVEGDVGAVAELMIRGWLTPTTVKKVDENVHAQARAVADANNKNEWLAERVQTRLAAISSGVAPEKAVSNKLA